MNERRTLNLVIASLVLVAVILVGILFFGKHPAKKTALPVGITAEQAADVQLVSDFANLKPVAAQDNRIVLYGDSLVGQDNTALVQSLSTTFNRKCDVINAPAGTSTDALVKLRPILEHPPKVLVLDVGRYYLAGGVAQDRTLANLALVVNKAKQIGVLPVLLLGPSSDGDLALASVVKSSMATDSATIDVTQLLMLSKYRVSPTVLNKDGVGQLSGQLVTALKPALGQ